MTVEKLNSSTKSLTEEETIQYMTKTIPITYPNMSNLPATAEEIRKYGLLIKILMGL
jgi:hypothetical protein